MNYDQKFSISVVVYLLMLFFLHMQAETFDGSRQPVVAIKGARVSDFGGRSLSCPVIEYSCCQP